MKVLNREGIIRMGGRSQGGGGVSVGWGSGSVAGLASEAWVEENYISKAFFNRLFTIHSASSVIDPNDPDEEQTIDSIEALVGLWTEQYLSALGQGSGGGGGGGITLNDPLDAINSAGLSDPVTAGSALVWYGGAWTYSPSARLQVAGLNSSAAVSVTGSVTATSFVRQGGTSSMFLKADGSVDTTVYAAQDWVSQNFITIQFFETLFNAVDANGNKVNANTTTGIDSIRAMFGFWTNEYLSALGQGTGGGGGGVTLNQPLSSINSAGLGAPSVSGSTLVWNGSTWTYSSSIGDTKNTAGSSQQPSGVQLYLIGASSQATWGVTYSNSGCYIGTDGYLYSGGSKVLTSSAGFVTGVSVNNGNPISPVNGVVALTDIMTTAGGAMTGSLSISGSGSHLSVGGNIGAQGTITSQDYITATGYKVPSGTSAGFLKADGSVDTTSYSTSDTLNTAGATAQPNSVIYLVGAGSYNSTYAVTYTNSECYISADGYLYSGGVKVITSTSGLVSGISIGGDTPIEPTNGIVQIPAYPVNTDTLNTAGSTQKPSNVALYLVGASAQATYGQTYSDSGCYISADGYLYSGGVRVLTSGNVVQTITINNGTPISPTNGNVNINCLTSISSSDVTTALGYTPAASSDLANYLPLTGGKIYNTTKSDAILRVGTVYNNRITAMGCCYGLGYGLFIGVSQTNSDYYIFHATSGIVDSDGTGAVSRFIIKPNGYVGIATETPSYLLDINGTCRSAYMYFKTYTGDSTAGYVGRGGSSSNAIYLTAYAGNACGIGANGTDNVIYINTTLNVGIGTISPATKLHVNGNVTATAFVKSGGTSSQFLKADGSVDSTSYSTSDTLNTAGATSQPNSTIYLVGAGSYNSTYSVTYTNSGCYIGADGYIYSGGSKVLTAAETGFLPLTGGDIYNTTSSDAVFEVGSVYSTNITTMRCCYGEGYGLFLATKTTSSNYFILNCCNSIANVSGVNAVSKFIVKCDGKVGIGTDSPSYLLDVNGISRINGYLAFKNYNNSSNAGYVGRGSEIYNNIQLTAYSGNSCGIGANGTDNVIYLTTTLNVGIGTTSPATKLDVNGNITGTAIIKRNGTSAQFLKADGSVDSTSYSTTDTKNTAGGTNLTGTKLYLVGLSTQDDNLRSYTNSNCYIGTDNCLYSGGSKVLTAAETGFLPLTGGDIYNTTSNDAVFEVGSVYSTNITTMRCCYGAGSGLFIGTKTTSSSLYLLNCSTGITNVGGSNATTQFIVKCDGKVGIGTGSPAYELDVIGTTRAGGLVFFRNYNNSSNAGYVGRGSSSNNNLQLTAYSGNGCGIGANGSDNIIYVTTSLNVGIGTTSPSYKLDINGSMMCSGLNSSGGGSIATDLTVGEHIYVEKIGNGMTNMRFNTNGNVGIGVNNTSGYLLQVNGACAGTSWTNLSDMRQKNYVEDESIELWQVASAPLFKFTWKNNAFGTDLHVGSSAQYWQTIVPEAVTTDGIGNLGLQYDVVALLAAITTAKKVQEHERRIEELERENKVLWNMIATLKSA